MTDAIRISVAAPVLGEELRQAAANARQLRIAGLSLSAKSPLGNLTELSQTAAREIRHVFSSNALAPAALAATLPGRGLSPDADGDRVIETILIAAHAARSCGFTIVTCDLGHLPPPPVEPVRAKAIDPSQLGAILLPTTPIIAPPPPPTPRGPAEEQHEAAAVEILRELARRLDPLGQPIAFSGGLASLAALENVLRQVDSPLFGVDLDGGALPGDAWDVDETFSRLGPLIWHVRGRDAEQGSNRTRPVALGAGDADWPALVGALRDLDYRGFITLDPTDLPDRRSGLNIGLNRLRELVA